MEKLSCWVCDRCRKIAVYKGCGLPIEVRAKKRNLHFCSTECKNKMLSSKTGLWVDVRTEIVLFSSDETDLSGNR